jgi:tetratricopeptide (TPR) repeat protein
MKSLLLSLFTSLTVAALCSAALARDTVDAKVARARALADNYYGDRRALESAATLVSEALRQDPKSAAAYIEAARITIKGGNIVSDQFRPGTIDLYELLIDRALAINPHSIAALSLRAEAYLLKGDLANAHKMIERGTQISAEDPWITLAHAEYHRRANNTSDYVQQLEKVVRAGTAPTERGQRRAYVRAQIELMRLFAVPENASLIQETAEKLESVLDPRDAWSLGNISDSFSGVGAFDAAVAYGRRAIRVMDYGVGRRHLAIALLGRAAQLEREGKESDAYVAEALALGANPNSVLRWFDNAEPEIAELRPAVARFLRQPAMAPTPARRKPSGS